MLMVIKKWIKGCTRRMAQRVPEQRSEASNATTIILLEAGMALSAQSAALIITSEVGATAPPESLMTAGIDKSDFCSIWPKAKPILQMLAGIALLIPGVGVAGGAVLNGLIKIADQIASETCK